MMSDPSGDSGIEDTPLPASGLAEAVPADAVVTADAVGDAMGETRTLLSGNTKEESTG
jgi:hypothetical protein